MFRKFLILFCQAESNKKLKILTPSKLYLRHYIFYSNVCFYRKRAFCARRETSYNNQWVNCGIAKHHGSLVTQQNFSTWRLYFSNEGRCQTHENCKNTFIIFALIKVLTKSVRLVSYFYCVLGFYERVWLKYSTWRTKSLKRGRSSIRSSREQIFEHFTT